MSGLPFCLPPLPTPFAYPLLRHVDWIVQLACIAKTCLTTGNFVVDLCCGLVSFLFFQENSPQDSIKKVYHGSMVKNPKSSFMTDLGQGVFLTIRLMANFAETNASWGCLCWSGHAEGSRNPWVTKFHGRLGCWFISLQLCDHSFSCRKKQFYLIATSRPPVWQLAFSHFISLYLRDLWNGGPSCTTPAKHCNLVAIGDVPFSLTQSARQALDWTIFA